MSSLRRLAKLADGHALKTADKHDSLAEWSKALASGASPQGRGFEPHSCHFSCLLFLEGANDAMSLAGLEPAIFGSEDQRLIH